MNERGFTLVEAVVAMAVLFIALVGMLPAYQAFSDSNTWSEQRSDAVAAAQQVMEALRQSDPATLPSSGSSSVQYIDVGEHEYEVVAQYCQIPSYCGTNTRHVVLEVSFGGEIVYTVESVYTRLR